MLNRREKDATPGAAAPTPGKMGEMLAATPRAKGTKGQLKGRKPSGGRVVLPPEKKEPTIAELGISRWESAEALPQSAVACRATNAPANPGDPPLSPFGTGPLYDGDRPAHNRPWNLNQNNIDK